MLLAIQPLTGVQNAPGTGILNHLNFSMWKLGMKIGLTGAIVMMEDSINSELLLKLSTRSLPAFLLSPGNSILLCRLLPVNRRLWWTNTIIATLGRCGRMLRNMILTTTTAPKFLCANGPQEKASQPQIKTQP